MLPAALRNAPHWQQFRPHPIVVHGTRHAVRWSIVLSVFLLALVLVLSVLLKLALPFLSNYKGRLELELAGYLGNPVSIGELKTRWGWTGPQLRAGNVTLLEPDGREARFDKLFLNVNVPLSLWRQQLHINELTLAGADLVLEVQSGGRLRLHGVAAADVADAIETVETGTVPSTPGSVTAKGVDSGLNVLSWLFNANRVGVLDANVLLLDEGRPPLRFSRVDVQANRRLDAHKLHLEIDLPAELGGQLEFNVELDARALELEDWSGELYLRGSDVHPQAWAQLSHRLDFVREHLLPVDGTVQAELWGTLLHGRIHEARGVLVVDQLRKRDGNELLNLLASEVRYRKLDHGWEAVLDQTTLDTGNQQMAFLPTRIEFDRRRERRWRWQGGMQDQSIAPVLSVARAWLDPGSALGKRLDALELAGEIRALEFRGGVDSNAPPQWHATAEFDQMQSTRAGLWPANSPIRLQLEANQDGLLFELPAQSLTLDWPVQFGSARQLDALDAEVYVQWPDQQIRLHGRTSLNDRNLDLSSWFSVVSAKGQSPALDIEASYSAADIALLRAWLPQAAMPKGINNWLQMALQGGELQNGTLAWRGTLADYPYENDEGMFDARFDVHDGRLRFLQSWPEAVAIDGSVQFDAAAVTAAIDSGQLDGIPLSDVSVAIDDFSNAVVAVEGTARAAAADALRFARQGPLQGLLATPLAPIRASGPMRVTLDLQAPLKRYRDAMGQLRFRPVQVDGAVHLAGNRVRIPAAGLDFRNARGSIGFNNNGIEFDALMARAYGSELQLAASTRGQGADKALHFEARGRVEPVDVLVHHGVPLDMFINGQSDVAVRAVVPFADSGGIDLEITSDLRGSAVHLGRPFGKSLDEVANLHVHARLGTASRTRQWRFDYQTGAGERARGIATTAAGSMQQLLVSLGDKEPVVTDEHRGVVIHGEVDTLGLIGWSDALMRLKASLQHSEDEGPVRPTLPVRAEIVAADWHVGLRSLGALELDVHSDATHLITHIENAHLAGRVDYPRLSDGTEAAVRIRYIDAEFVRALSEPDPDSPAQPTAIDPRTLPPFDIHAERIDWDALRLRDFALRTEHEVAGQRISALGFATDTTQLIGSGHWRVLDPQNVNSRLQNRQQTRLHMTLQSSDFGEGLGELGFPGVIAAGEGSILAHLNWPDALYRPALAALEGEAQLSLSMGSVLRIEPGAARMIGLFALDALPRRLNFDFNDITRDGLEFQTLVGDLYLDEGVVNSGLIQLSGPVGVIDIMGSSDLISRSYDQKIAVLPRVSAALPIIGAITGGATAGIGAWLAGPLFKAIGLDFDRIGYREYRLSGSWNEPELSLIR